ncbi:hypothetical protein, partial [Streptomyces acidiscabies]|uniref:hypothetical protein n=1 Tax=Streptomyces acidiscabies TaxID=42234 RepID=UPI001F427B9E
MPASHSTPPQPGPRTRQTRPPPRSHPPQAQRLAQQHDPLGIRAVGAAGLFGQVPEAVHGDP